MTCKYFHILSLVVVLTASLWSGSVQATSVAVPVDGQSSAGAETHRVPDGEVLSLTVDEGQVIHLPRPATSVFVANPAIADVQVKSGALLYLLGAAVGQTSFYAVDAQDNVIVSKQIVVGMNLSGLRRAIHQVTGDDRVQVQQVEDMLLLSGKVNNAATVQDVLTAASRYLPRSVRAAPDAATAGTYILNRMEIEGSNQVNIRVRIAEVSRSAIKTLGLTSHVANPSLFGDVNVAIGFDPTVAAAESLATGGISTTWGATTLSTALDALASDGLATVLAEPNLTALSGETANFLAGGEYPIPIVNTASGSSTVTIEFREYGIRLAFTPTVTSGGRINLRVRPEVSELDNSTAVSFGSSFVPGLRTRRAETSVELGSGQSFAIAGLLKNDSSQDISKYPGLGDIPILGALFRSERFQQDQSELVILVTPYLVKPVAANALQSPTDGFVPPNDVDRHLHNRLVSGTPTPAPVHTAERGDSAAGAGLVGPVGYVLQ